MPALITNIMACAPGATPTACGVDSPLLGPKNGPIVEVFVPAGQVIELTMWSLPVGGTVTVSESDSAACASGLTIPYSPCGVAMIMSDAQRTVFLGPGRYQLEAVGLLAGFNVKVRNVYELASIQLRDYQCV